MELVTVIIIIILSIKIKEKIGGIYFFNIWIWEQFDVSQIKSSHHTHIIICQYSFPKPISAGG